MRRELTSTRSVNRTVSITRSLVTRPAGVWITLIIGAKPSANTVSVYLASESPWNLNSPATVVGLPEIGGAIPDVARISEVGIELPV